VTYKGIFVVVVICLGVAIALMVAQRWPRASALDHVLVTPAQQFALHCGNAEWAGVQDIETAIARIKRGEDSAWNRGNAFGELQTALMICFPVDMAHPDAFVPLTLLRPLIDERTTPEQLKQLEHVIDGGWKKSTIGEPWRGTVR
jgi:hypothetical protein